MDGSLFLQSGGMTYANVHMKDTIATESAGTRGRSNWDLPISELPQFPQNRPYQGAASAKSCPPFPAISQILGDALTDGSTPPMLQGSIIRTDVL